MGRKIFVSYKYADANVKSLPGYSYLDGPMTARRYVDELERILGKSNVCKCEHEGEDLSGLSDGTIEKKLSDRIYDSTVTVVLVSPGMRDRTKPDRDQWIPWEVAMSIRLLTRGGRTSQRNSVIAVILPDRLGSYAYAEGANGRRVMPSVLWNNIEAGYVYVVKWDAFKDNYERYVALADYYRENVPEYKIQKVV